MQMNHKLKLAGNVHQMMTPAEYWGTYEPGMFALLLDLDEASAQAINDAEQVAHDLNLPGDPVSGRYHIAVWQILFP